MPEKNIEDFKLEINALNQVFAGVDAREEDGIAVANVTEDEYQHSRYPAAYPRAIMNTPPQIYPPYYPSYFNNTPHGAANGYYPLHQISYAMNSQQVNSTKASAPVAQPTKKRLGIIDPLTGKDILQESGNEETPSTKGKFGRTPLHFAALKGQTDTARSLIEEGADVNSHAKDGFTPLHFAAQGGHVAMASLLLEHDADVNSRAKNDFSPLHMCAKTDNVDIATLLLKNGANPYSKDEDGLTPLDIARKFRRLNMIKFLTEYEKTERGLSVVRKESQASNPP